MAAFEACCRPRPARRGAMAYDGVHPDTLVVYVEDFRPCLRGALRRSVYVLTGLVGRYP